jgi:CRISPR-associated protein Csm1
VWGVLRGDVDSFGIRMRRLQSIEEYVQLSVLYKQFFAGEVEVLCSLPEFWRKVNLLHTGGDDFAVYGRVGCADRICSRAAAPVPALHRGTS